MLKKYQGPRNYRRPNKYRGFTLIELMVVLAILVILVGLGVPSFSEIIRANRLATQTNKFVTAINLARSEAVKRNHRVVLCKINTAGTNCDNSKSWKDGWLVFVDKNSDDDVDSGEDILRVFEPMSAGYRLTPSSSANYISYRSNGTGGPNSGVITNFEFLLCADNALEVGKKKRSITFAPGGRVRLEEVIKVCT